MIFQDDRTAAERATLTVLVGGRDSFMSGWGKADGGSSFAYWACEPDQVFAVSSWVEARGDITLVPIADLLEGDRHETEHCHVYAVRANHVSLEADGQHQVPPGGGQ